MTRVPRLSQHLALPRNIDDTLSPTATSYNANHNMISPSTIPPIHSPLGTTSKPRHVLGSALPSAWNQVKPISNDRRTARPHAAADVETPQGLRRLGANALLEGSVASPRLGHDADTLESGGVANLWGSASFKTRPLRLDTGIENRIASDFAPAPRTNSTSSAASSIFTPHDRILAGQFDLANLGRPNITSQDNHFGNSSPLPLSNSYLPIPAGRIPMPSSVYQCQSGATGHMLADGVNSWNSTVRASPSQASHNASTAGSRYSNPAVHNNQPTNWAPSPNDTPLSGIESGAGWHGSLGSGLHGHRLPMSLGQQRPSYDDNNQSQIQDSFGALTLSSARSYGRDEIGKVYKNEIRSPTNEKSFSPPPSRHYSYDTKPGRYDTLPTAHFGSFLPADHENSRLSNHHFTPDSAISLHRSTDYTLSPSSISYAQSEQTSAGAELTALSNWPSQFYPAENRARSQNYDNDRTWIQPIAGQTAPLRRDNVGIGASNLLPPHHYGIDPLAPQYPYGFPMTAPQESAGIRSRLLEEFKTKSRASRRWELREIYNHIPEFAGDQLGSRFIQEKLVDANSEQKMQVFNELLPCAAQLTVCVFGNYVIQKFFDHGDQTQKKQLANTLKGRVLYNSLNTYGCRVVQKALEHVLLDQQVTLMEELRPHIIKCVMNQNGNHVIQVAIERVPAQHVRFIIDSFVGHVQQLSVDKYACRVVQRLLERGEQLPRSIIIGELHACAHNLIANDYGNYVVQELVMHGSDKDKEKVFDLIKANLVGYARHKFASNVVEKCLVYGADHHRKQIMQHFVARGESKHESILSTLSRDQFANYVIQRLLETLSPSDHARFAEVLLPEIAKARRFGANKYLDEVEKCLQKFGTATYGTPSLRVVASVMRGTPTPPLTADGEQTPRSSSVPSRTDEAPSTCSGSTMTSKQMPAIQISQAAI